MKGSPDLLLLAALLSVAGPVRAEDTVKTFRYGEPFELAFGESARGPQGLEIQFDALFGSGADAEPGLRLATPAASGYPTWARPSTWAPGDFGGRGLWRDWVVTLLAVEAEEPHTATVEVRREQTRPFPVGEPFVLEPYSFARSPDGWALGLRQAAEVRPGHLDVRLVWQRPDMESESLTLTCETSNPATTQVGWNDYLVAAREVLSRDGGPAAVRLEVWKPAETWRSVAYGEPFVLFPGETAATPDGLQVRLDGFGHKITMDGGDESFVEFTWTRGDDSDFARLYWLGGSREASAELAGVTLTVIEADWGPPHHGDRPTALRLDHPEGGS